ncbi:GrpB family protein [Chitinophaga ginsengisegetis]|nr:GrpB family protein [Chitinophaga ginsengisegetis]MDR6569523.1 GrpB-like predicted nucleotidyltransferase (UPF0157 family) [Chitinophaga ginsengisegetis]MDR6649256.1 GrpB-like predicted nucleotidyltransferase (UPF0157 family) [Chitinophaga ginsengisegetis]MDR6655606.1 GrpB-like predicted nucleotidyltransferase (UPF0157 family) [Chitinophaga ginsengisegetis]
MSETIEILPYSPCWPEEFPEIAREPGDAAGEYALAIDHIGSTSGLYPGR